MATIKKIGNVDVCECNVAASFPILGGLGIISASLRTNVNVSITEGGMVLASPTYGDLSITGYAPLVEGHLDCVGKAGASYQWEQRIDCDTTGSLIIRFIPRGKSKAYMEGAVTRQIEMMSISDYMNFSASASSGPNTPYFKSDHYDGYDFIYRGGPIPIAIEDQYKTKNVSIFNGILPAGTKLYLTNFSWDYTPPNIPNVSYSFLVSYTG